jgi:tRNA (guanine37-N1)-methyltransferase
MRFDVVSLFPQMVIDAAANGVTGRAIKTGRVELAVWNPREFTNDRHRTVDDRPYGGGPGMVMKFEPLTAAVDKAKQAAQAGASKVVYLSPQGRPMNQALLVEASQLQQLILIAGRYEGVDQRFIDINCDEEWSLGDFVISGGELAALVVIDAITRLLPGVLGDEQSANQDSHMHGLLDCPHYTRPKTIAGLSVPEVLLGGNHAAIESWRLKQILGSTWQKRPDLLEKIELTNEQLQLLKEFKTEIDV